MSCNDDRGKLPKILVSLLLDQSILVFADSQINAVTEASEIMREVAWVIFDEIHYMRDAERGVVWEETIILLPHTVRYVFLSATIPNAMQFAEWICKSHEATMSRRVYQLSANTTTALLVSCWW